MDARATLRLLAAIRNNASEEERLKALQELESRLNEEEKILERQKRVYEDEINILKEVSNLSTEEAKYRLSELKRESVNLKRENLETKIALDSANRKNLELNEEIERLELRALKIQGGAAKDRQEWAWNVEALKAQREILNREMGAVQTELEKHLKEWKETLELMHQKSSSELAEVKNRLFEDLYKILGRQKMLIVNEERTLLSGLVRFIQNQIGGLAGTAELLKERADRIGPADRKWDIAGLLQLSPLQLKRELEFMVGVINEKSQAIEQLQRGLESFREFARQPEMKPEKIELAQMLNDWAEGNEDFLKQASVAVEKSLGKTAPIMADKNFLDLALRELVQNAGEGAPKEAVVHLRTETDPENAWVGFSVIDNGPGIPEHLRGKIFEPFFTTKKDRLGLGLSKALLWISLMGGELVLAPSPSGAKFLVKFPIYQPGLIEPS